MLRPLLAAALAASAAGAATDAEFERGADPRAALGSARRAAGAMSAPDGGPRAPEGGSSGQLWVTVGRSDLSAPAGAEFPLGAPVAGSAHAALYRVDEGRLPELADYMHERFGKCGGFFAYDDESEARRDLMPMAATGGGPYTIDQQETVKPLLPQVVEGELRGTISALAGFQNRYYQADSGISAAQWIQGRWQALVKDLPGASVELVSHPGWKQPSVVLTIPGAEKADELVVLGGHLDSINGWSGASARAPGADDNASGIAVLTEAVRVLGGSGWRPARTVKVMGYAAEEVGLRGSKEIANSFASRGLKVAGVIQYDMTNYKGSGGDLYLVGDNTDAAQNAFLGKLIDEYLGISWSTTNCGYACSDHASWTRAGFPASAAFESEMSSMNRRIHTANDTLENSGGDAKHSVNFAKLAVAYAVELAKTAKPGPAPAAGR